MDPFPRDANKLSALISGMIVGALGNFESAVGVLYIVFFIVTPVGVLGLQSLRTAKFSSQPKASKGALRGVFMRVFIFFGAVVATALIVGVLSRINP